MMPAKNVLVVCVLIAAPVFGQEASQRIVIGESFSIESDILNETRQVYVSTPVFYDRGTQSYGVLYVLDGEAHFRHTVGSSQFLGGPVDQTIPPLLVVGIGNTDRMRDMTPPLQEQGGIGTFVTQGGADRFLRFIIEELRPWVDERYRTSDYSILVGHSLAGLFAVHAFITQPDSFDSYVAIDPSLNWNGQELVRQAGAFLDTTPDLDASLYFAVSSEERPELDGVRRFIERLEANAPNGLRWDLNPIVTESHGTIPLLGTYHALRWTFASWDIEDEAQAMFRDAPGEEILRDIDVLYQRSGEQFGLERETPQLVFEYLLNYLALNDRLDEGARLTLSHSDRYPLSLMPNVVEGIASLYVADGKDDAAIAYLSGVLEVDPENEAARRVLVDMGVDAPPE